MFTNTAKFPIAAGGHHRWAEGVRWHTPIYWLIVASVLCALRATSLLIDRGLHGQEIVIPPSVVTDFAQRSSHGGLYRGEVTAATARVGEPQRWIVQLRRRNGRRLANADVQVRLWMPETGIESVVRATGTYIGGGIYRLDPLLFTRPGWWNVALVVTGSSGIDSLAFNVRMP